MHKSLYGFTLVLIVLTACSSKDNPAAIAPTESLPPTVELNLTDASTQAYDLDWKLADDEIIGYRTVLELTPNSDTSTRFDLGDLTDDDETGFLDEFEQAMANLSIPAPQETIMVSLLEPTANGNISVKMIVDALVMPEEDTTTSRFSEMMLGMVGTVQLEGELTPDGAIASLLIPEAQRNLLAMLFELPTTTVQVGDRWALDIDCISGPSPDNSFRTNQVEFVELSQSESGQLVAVLNYTIIEIEKDSGQSLSGETIESNVSCSFLGEGRFLIDEGRWERFSGELSIQSSGIMTANNTQTFILTPLDEIPPQYIDLE